MAIQAFNTTVQTHEQRRPALGTDEYTAWDKHCQGLETRLKELQKDRHREDAEHILARENNTDHTTMMDDLVLHRVEQLRLQRVQALNLPADTTELDAKQAESDANSKKLKEKLGLPPNATIADIIAHNNRNPAAIPSGTAP